MNLHDGAYHLLVGTTYVRLTGSYNPALPHTVHITLDLNARTYTLCINDEIVALKRPLYDAAFLYLQSLRFSAMGPVTEAFPSEYVVDDIQISR